MSWKLIWKKESWFKSKFDFFYLKYDLFEKAHDNHEFYGELYIEYFENIKTACCREINGKIFLRIVEIEI